MRVLVSALGLALLLPVTAAAQTVRGVVLEEGSTAPIVGATIELLLPDSTLQGSVVSDKQGWFHLEASQEGRYLVRVTHLSFRANELDTVRVGKHEIVTLMVRMGRVAIPLAPLVVAARTYNHLAGFYERAETQKLGKFVRREWIQARIARPPSALLMMTPGVYVTGTPDGFSGGYISVRGPSGVCPANVYLDGLPVPQEIGMTIDELTASELIEGIEIYDGYGMLPPGLPIPNNPMCGVVAFWSTRESRRPFSWKAMGAFLAGAGVMFLLTKRGAGL